MSSDRGGRVLTPRTPLPAPDDPPRQLVRRPSLSSRRSRFMLTLSANSFLSVGFTLGFLDLSHFPLLAWLGGGQFRKFCMVIILILGATVWLTCWSTVEVARVLELGERPGSVHCSLARAGLCEPGCRSLTTLLPFAPRRHQPTEGHRRQPLQSCPSPSAADPTRLLRPDLCVHVLGAYARLHRPSSSPRGQH